MKNDKKTTKKKYVPAHCEIVNINVSSDIMEQGPQFGSRNADKNAIVLSKRGFQENSWDDEDGENDAFGASSQDAHQHDLWK